MEFETFTDNSQPIIGQRLFTAVVPVLLIAVSYVDPGKWAAAVEGGARFGFDLVFPVLIFNFAAIFCQYLSARIAVVTSRDLAQICSEEYDKVTCMLLGVQAEVSMIALDLMMVLGTAHGLNVLFGIDLFTGVFLTAVNAALFPLLATVLEKSRAKFLVICVSVFILVSYIFGVFVSQPASPLSLGGIVTRLNGESAFALMSLLGANIMPHNFYLHSSVVQLHQGPTNVPKEALYHDHFFAIFCIFSGIFLVNYVVMSSAANVFSSADPVSLIFQDAMDQVFRSSIAPLFLILLMFLLNQVTALTWNLAGQGSVHDFFKMDIPGWLHHATIRVIAVIPALYCVWHSGAEGVYRLLIFTQVVVSLMLPSAVIPLFRVASSRSLMGNHKISQWEEFLALITFIGILGLKIIFFIELVFGDCDWVSNLRWNIGSTVPVTYVILLVAASLSFFLMLWLAATPLKSATPRPDAQVLDWDIHHSVRESCTEGEQNDAPVPEYHMDKPTSEQEPPVTFEKSLGIHPESSTSSPNLSLPDTLFDSENILPLTTIEENKSEVTFSTPACPQDSSPTELDMNLDVSIYGDVSVGESQNARAMKTESIDLVAIEKSVQSVKDDRESWEPEKPTKEVPETNQPLTSEGPGSFRSPSGKSDDVGSGTGSLSRLAGLGRAARRQFAAVLDEFWGLMFDFHGQSTQEAKARKLDLLLGLDLKLDAKSSLASVNLDNSRTDFTGYFPSLSGQGSDSLTNSSSYNSPGQQMGQSMIESPFGVQRGSSPLWSSHVQLLDAYVRNSSRNSHDSGERRYSSMHIPAPSDGYNQQPATVHGYELASYLSRIAKERGSGILNGQMESPASQSTASVSSPFRDSFARPIGKKPQNGMSTLKPPGFHNISVSRNNALQPERSTCDVSSPKPTENPNSSINVKKFYSLPDISGLRIPYKESTLSDKSGKWDNSVVYGQSVGSNYDRTSLSVSSRTEAPPGFHGRSPSRVCRDPFSLQCSSSSSTVSLWSRQPYEQFCVADKSHTEGEQVKVSYTQETVPAVDSEAMLLQSFRYSIMKLLKLEGSDWLFGQNDGADEDLIDRVAAREKFLFEAETVQMNWPSNTGEAQFYSDRKPGSAVRSDDTDYAKFLVTSVSHCGEDCVYKVDLIISFGVWCIHRILELSLMESRPELWGKYTYVLNRLQGIIDLAFFRPRTPMNPCICLQIPAEWQQKSSPPISNGSLPPTAKQVRGKCTTPLSLLEKIKDVEIAISCRKGRTGTAAGDVAFPKGKENLASVLKRYKRRLSNKQIGSQDGGSGSRKASSSLHYGL